MRIAASVVMTNWNGRHLLAQSLPALLNQTYPDYEVVLVDNGSQDGSAAFVRENFSSVRLIGNPANLGFAAGTNMGIRASRGRYIATLNNDTQAEPHWLAELVAASDSESAVGMWASKMLLAQPAGRIDAVGISLDYTGTATNRLAWRPDRGPADEPAEVFGPCGGAALYRREMLEAVGLFDEDFFCYYEDVDLAWRARLAGWGCRYVPSALVHHRHSATGGLAPSLKDYFLARNRIWTIVKNYPAPQWYAFWPLIVAYDLLSLAGKLSLGRWSALGGRVAALRGLGRALAKRRAIQARLATEEGRRATWRLMEGPASPWERLRGELGLGHALQKGN